ncbi:Alanine--tRNA ligase, mitochondrial [Merluccius polli]|uniref:Alanine--tRNA ligase n=1 Tax=Merluccius polli TaxID=89951 RepID=A0AA47MJF6_MERPO|nr:Alanine--tRNA ligase, mitochondrial [Merluccius polli]
MNVLVRVRGLGGPLRRSYSTRFSSREVRRTFIEFFEGGHGHRVVPSAPVRPRGDPSLLFVNAGMNQFKPILLGTADPRSELAGYRRVVNSQKCVRAGGKHNDLDDVGRDVYHHTFFEMLGNWSFGDYFKEEACAMAWSLLTEHYGMSPDRLYVSYFSGDAGSGLPADEETRDIWLDLGVPRERVLPFGLQENFWEMGDTGPCGPCSEIHYDHLGGRDASRLVNTASPEVVELWNLVFMQYNREADGSLRPLPHHSVDTGLGLERLLAVLQDAPSNYDTDLFRPLLDHIHQVSRCGPYGGRVAAGVEGRVDMAYRVVADHIRTLAVCIADGVYPGMSGPELVLRRILRRAVRFSTEVLQAPQGALGSLVPTVVHILGDAYPELQRHQEQISAVIDDNEQQFLSSLQQGVRIINKTAPLPSNHSIQPLFPAPVAWSLHRNLGFPLDLLDLILEERGLQVDRVLLDQLLDTQQKRRSEGGTGSESEIQLDVHSLASLQHQGVEHTDQGPKYQYNLHNGRYVFPECTAEVRALFIGQQQVSEVAGGQRCLVILDRTSFYAEQGGQSHDLGYLSRLDLPDVLYPVEEVAVAGGYVLHLVSPAYALKVGDRLHLHLDQAQRLACMVKHTATHILNWALRCVLGPSTQQRGSHVAPHRLRFDFSVKVSLGAQSMLGGAHSMHRGLANPADVLQGSLSTAQLQEVERLVEEVIAADHELFCQEVPLKSARTIPGLRTVDEVYPDPVRVVSVGVPVTELLGGQTDGHHSVELCCGTHLLRTGAIEDLVVVSERQIVKGISRVVALTGEQAKQAREAGQVLAQDVASLTARTTTSSRRHDAQRLSKEVGLLTDAVDSTPIPQGQRRELQAQLRSLQRSTNTAVRKVESQEVSLLAELGLLVVLHTGPPGGCGDGAVRAQGVLQQKGEQVVLVDSVEADSLSVLMKTVNQVSSKRPHSLVMLLSHQQRSGKVLCACQVPKDCVAVAAHDWAVAVCSHLGGSAGGSQLVAKGMGTSSDITEALRWAEEYAHCRTPLKDPTTPPPEDSNTPEHTSA